MGDLYGEPVILLTLEAQLAADQAAAVLLRFWQRLTPNGPDSLPFNLTRDQAAEVLKAAAPEVIRNSLHG